MVELEFQNLLASKGLRSWYLYWELLDGASLAAPATSTELANAPSEGSAPPPVFQDDAPTPHLLAASFCFLSSSTHSFRSHSRGTAVDPSQPPLANPWDPPPLTRPVVDLAAAEALPAAAAWESSLGSHRIAAAQRGREQGKGRDAGVLNSDLLEDSRSLIHGWESWDSCACECDPRNRGGGCCCWWAGLGLFSSFIQVGPWAYAGRSSELSYVYRVIYRASYGKLMYCFL